MNCSRCQVVVLIPSYNTGRILASVVREALGRHDHVWVLVDGSTDGSADPLRTWSSEFPGFRLIEFSENRGKGATLLEGARLAVEAGFTHGISMDSDGQHPADYLPNLVAWAERESDALIMGRPVFDESVPLVRLMGRQLTLAMTDYESAGYGLGDTLYGFRVYPLEPLLQAFEQTRCARGYDFDPEIAVRLFWLGIRPVQVSIPVRYLSAEAGGVSHFHYLRDNVKLTLLHFRLVPEFLFQKQHTLSPLIRRWKHACDNPRELAI